MLLQLLQILSLKEHRRDIARPRSNIASQCAEHGYISLELHEDVNTLFWGYICSLQVMEVDI